MVFVERHSINWGRFFVVYQWGKNMTVCGLFRGIYKGVAEGTSAKSGKQWTALKFILEENVNGANLDPAAMVKPNATIFPPEGDYSHLNEGEEYILRMTVSSRKGSDYPDYGLVSVQPKRTA